MLKVGLIGIGMMGFGHLVNYQKLEKEGFPIELVAICDKEQSKLDGKQVGGNLNFDSLAKPLSHYNLYTDIDTMLEEEELDMVDIVLPSDLHADVAIRAMKKGIHVLCEKPMALNSRDCQSMIATSEETNMKLMIAQVLRFWPIYNVIKDTIEKGELGKVLAAHFYRRGSLPIWSQDNWMLQEERSGSVLLDLHVHDVDLLQSIFGLPNALSAIGIEKVVGSGINHVTAHYMYDDKVIQADASWIHTAAYGFKGGYSIVFEKGVLELVDGVVYLHPEDGERTDVELPSYDGYYQEIKYFATCIMENISIAIATPESTMDTITLLAHEKESASNNGQIVTL